MSSVFLSIKNGIYEVSQFIGSHPGEGINSVYLNEHNRKNVTEEYEKYHTSELAEEELILAKKGENPKIKYIGPNYFQKNIPKYFHLIDLELADVEEISKNMTKKSFFMFPSSTTIDKSDFQLNLFVRDANGCVNIYPLNFKFSGNSNKIEKCYVELYDIKMNEKLEEENVITSVLDAGNIELFVDKYFTKQKYIPIIKM